MSALPPRHRRPPAFFLAEGACASAPRLRAEDEEHARRVLRVSRGAELIGLDGRGGWLALRVRAVERTGLALEAIGPMERTPAPGEEGSMLPWFELAISWPRRNRVEDMLGRLVQLGAGSLRPLEARQRGPEEPPRSTDERLERLLREACKQSGRRWLPILEACLTPSGLVEARATSPIAVLDPRAALSLDTWLRSLRPSPLGVGTRARPIVFVIGPEGGLAEDEIEALEGQGASRVWLGPHVMRIETAAEAAMAVAGVVHGRPESWREEAPLAERDEALADDDVVEHGNA